MKSLNIMKPFDEYVLKSVQTIKASEQYQKIQNTYSSMEEKEQSLIQAIIIAAIVLVPTIIVLGFYTVINSYQSSLEMKENIINHANSIIKQDSQLKRESRKALARNLGTQGNFKTNITSALSRANIDSAKLKVLNYDSYELSGGIEKVSADLKFTGFSSENLYAFTRVLGISKKVKIDEVDLIKNKQSNLLDGTFKVLYFSKMPMEDL